MFHCLLGSIEGDLQTTLFGQEGNLPENEDGPALFMSMIDMTVAASLMISIQALDDLQHLDPAAHNFSIPLINTKFGELFTLATTSSRAISDGERIQYVLTAYDRIKQPAEWTQWVAKKIDSFEEGTLVTAGTTGCQDLMNAAILKASRIHAAKHGSSRWRTTSIEDDVVAMMANKPVANKTAKSSKPEKMPTFCTPLQTPRWRELQGRRLQSPRRRTLVLLRLPQPSQPPQVAQISHFRVPHSKELARKGRKRRSRRRDGR